MKAIVCFVAAVVVLEGCTWDMDAAGAREGTVRDLCQTIGAAKAGNATSESGAVALEELRHRRAFSEPEMALIVQRRVAVGMSEQAGLCAWGYYWYDLNETITAGGTSRQYVFGDGTYLPRRYLYTENGIVTAIQS